MSRVTLGAIMAALLQVSILSNGGPSPLGIGNRANHFSYQPTPAEVDGAERTKGLRPSDAQQQAVNQELLQLDRQLLRAEGVSTKSVPDIKPR